MVLVGFVMDTAWIEPITVGVITGIWWALAIGIPVAIVLGVLISRYCITHTVYVCLEDHIIFRPPLKESLFVRHTPSMRMLTCPTCGKKSYCLEIYAPSTTPTRDGRYLIWPSAGE